jgi:NOL1/NOP2/fmu family ribosome biogenesis protein
VFGEMANLIPLNTKKIQEFENILQEQFGASFGREYIWFLHEKEQDIYLLSKDAKHLDFERLRINNLGLYVAHKDNNDEIRLPIEGAQLLGPHATKNVISIPSAEKRLWLRGHDLETKEDMQGYVILESGGDFIGCGRIKEGKILNFVPKGRRIASKD